MRDVLEKWERLRHLHRIAGNHHPFSEMDSWDECPECGGWLGSLDAEDAAAECGSCGAYMTVDNEGWLISEPPDELAISLEEWAQSAESGETLDRVCMDWRFPSAGWLHDTSLNVNFFANRQPSRDAGASMELFIMMQSIPWHDILQDGDGGIELWQRQDIKGLSLVAGDSERVDPLVSSTDTKLAIARACAVLSARGIEPHYQGLL